MKTKSFFCCAILSIVIVSCVKEPQPIRVSSITLNSSSLELVEGESADLVATISPKDADNQTVIWSSTNGSVASVSNGKITALAPGSTTITAKSDDGGFTASCSVTVVAKIINVSSLSLSIAELTLTEGDSETIIATVKPDDATDKTVTWSTSDESIATVDGGIITAIKEGTATITAKTGDKEATCSVIVSPRSYQNLSENGTANCYVISSKGAYRFKADVKGGTSVSIGNPYTAEVLWESFGTNDTPNVGDVVSNVKFTDGFISFISGKEGNAVIAAKDSNGVILWSWHIWVCDGYNLEDSAIVYKNDAGIMMDRNLGALSAEKGSNLGFGLLYQWGRKDPFMSSYVRGGTTPAKTTGTWPSPVFDNSVLDSDPVVTGDTKQYQIEHPMTFIRSRSGNKTDGSTWSIEKSESDPCPYGWKIPDEVWSKAIGSKDQIMYSGLWDDENNGIDGQQLFGTSTWYPAGSEIDGRTGELTKYFTLAGPNGVYHGVNSFFAFYKAYDGLISPSTQFSGGQFNGFFVRCVKE